MRKVKNVLLIMIAIIMVLHFGYIFSTTPTTNGDFSFAQLTENIFSLPVYAGDSSWRMLNLPEGDCPCYDGDCLYPPVPGE